MSIFNEFLPKLNEISKDYIKNFNNDLEAVFQCFDKFEEDYQHGKSRAREKVPKDKNLTTLQSINETEDESTKTPENEKPSRRSSTKSKSTDEGSSSLDSNGERRGSKKRSKNEVDGISSPEQDKRQKRNASVKAQSIITKQANETTKVLEESNIINLDTPKRGVNVNLTQKLRREEPAEKARRRRPKDDEKENAEPALIVPLVQVKQEKISLPPEPMDMESLPLDIEVKKEVNKDEIAMPPPAVPVPKPRKAVQKEKSEESSAEEDSGNNKRRTTRTRKQTDTMPPPPVAASRATRASSRATRRTEGEESAPETRPKRTRAKKKTESESSNADTEKENQAPQENGIGSPAEKPRPKRTRRGQKAAEKEEVQKPTEKPVETITEPPLKEKPVEATTELPLKEKPVEATTEPPLKEERITQEVVRSPIIQQKTKITKKPNRTKTKDDDMDSQSKINLINDTTKTIIAPDTLQESALAKNLALEETRIIAKDSTAANGNGDMDKTVVLPNGVYNHAPVTPKIVRAMNETVVLDKNRETIVLDKPKNAIMDATVVIEKDTKRGERLTDDNSLLTDDSDYKDPCTPPQPPPATEPTSAVKEKVQQFEEMATRVTRTKTRAMAKKDTQVESETQTPPDKVSKPVLSAETLQKMDSLIFNGKVPQISSSASKPKATTTTQPKHVTSSASKLSGINKAREAEDQRNEREDARRKKEAMLEAKREMQKRKREEKMAAAAASRSQAERERRAAMQAAARERLERQAHADHGRLLRLREVEKRKQELARKAAETEERRRAEETARQQRLADEQRRAELARRKQIEEAEAMKKEAAIMAREIEKRQKEYIEKQKMKQRMEGEKISTPLKLPGTPTGYPPMEPVYMSDGFQYLNSDEDEEPVERPVPAWSTSKARRQHLYIQVRVAPALVERLFAVRTHSPDLRAIFPDIERARLKRTSSAVWRTPPRLPVVKE